MSTADFKAAVQLAVETALGLVKTDKAPPVPAPAPVKPAADDLRAKRLAALEKARAAKKAKAKAKPAAKPAAESPKQKPVEVKADAPAWVVKPHTTQKGVKGKIINVGPFNAWLADGDEEKRVAILAAINGVFRHAQCNDLVKAICG
jgi:hypothetical protein